MTNETNIENQRKQNLVERKQMVRMKQMDNLNKWNISSEVNGLSDKS